VRRAEPGRTEDRLQGRAALADEDRRRGALGDDRRQLGQVDALVATAGDQHDRWLEGSQRGDHGVRLRALRVIDELDTVDDRNPLEAVLDALERGRSLPDGVRGKPEVEPDGDRREGVEDVVGSWDRQLANGHDGSGAVRDDPAVLDADAARSGRALTVEDDRRSGHVGVGRDDRVVGVEDQGSSGIDELRQPPLRRSIARQRAVAVEVVGGDVRVDSQRRPARERRQLQLGQLDDDAVRRRELRQALDQRDPDVAAQDDRVLRIGREDGGDQ
jgi:hypothetical protein